ncbi:ligand-binding sensor domain-containing protein [Pedobacter westerhofensis]|uniref:histidine kinase n=1 Tax=Pedobacter westerhofensis TaxID=425512 RepID=A0A521FJV0_9SPHI|nr:two-component regulator propeller domain-containing protein [Pedobacter westerhofensis]SMO96396.1 ligand-binding sensor domain-containing protein [Pedobacter westerhofensis]
MYRKIFLTITGCILSSLLLAQQEQIQFSRLDVSAGLSHNQVNTMLKDAGGFMWFATLSGLNRYDGYQFKVFKHDPGDTTSITDDFVTGIFELPGNHLYLETRNGPSIYDPATETFIRKTVAWLKKLRIYATVIKGVIRDDKGDFWFNAAADGVYKYSPASGTTLHLPARGLKKDGLAATPIAALQKDQHGNIWLIHRDKTIEMLSSATGKVMRRIEVFRQRNPADFNDYRIFADQSGALWVYTMNVPSGISYYDPATGELRLIEKRAGGLNNNLVNGIVQDDKGLIWIGTDHGGVNLLDKKGFRIRYLLNKENDPKSIGQNSILSVYKDNKGIMWLGTFKKGISFYHPKILKFPLYRYEDGNVNGLAYDDINRFAEDGSGNIWVGTNGGGLFYFNRKTGKFSRYLHRQDDSNSLSNDIIVSLCIDRQKKLWIGTYFGGLSSFDGQHFKHFRHQASDNNSLADDRVWDILQDREGIFWIATLGGGLDQFDPVSGIFTHHRAVQPNSVGSDFLSCLMEDAQGNLWIGTADGIDVRKTDGRFVHYKNIPGQPHSLINNIVYDLMQDSYGFIWVATRDGISRFDPHSGLFRNFDSDDGLTEKSTLKILEDSQRNLWLSTANGLFNILVKPLKNAGFSYSFRKYDQQDGLQGIAFNANAGYKTRGGELLFGGASGFNLFRPGEIHNDNTAPAVVLTDLWLANRRVPFAQTTKLNLKYNQNGFTIAFAALNFFNPQKIRYRYMLQGFDHHWQEPQNDGRRAVYTNIDPGRYVFRLMSTDAEGNWRNNERRLEIEIKPPFWRSTLAYILYLAFAGGTLLLIRRRGIMRIKKEFLIVQERKEAKRMHELDLLKIRFLTNISHEFRTPLSLIITPMEKLIREARPADRQQLQMIQRNGRRLLNLVNQLLDFRKMEEHELKLHAQTGDIIRFIRELSYSFGDVADRKNIRLQFESDKISLVTVFDHDKLERILFNLLSNAFKFTPQGGEVKVTVELSSLEEGMTELRLRISDTGIGIPLEQQEKIFDRFFQHEVPDFMLNQGSGIGLSITQEFVRLHGGTISVKSAVNEGSEFSVILILPAQPEQATVALKADEDAGLPLTLAAAPELLPATGLQPATKKPLVLLVEDNEDFRFYLKANLKDFYELAEAADGREGWQKALALHPDLVVSDVSMPEMNGIDLCKKIRADKRTAHLPVILLTALTSEDQQLTGLETGANDYMTKPFNLEILLSKIRNLLHQQAISRKTYRKQLDFKPAETEIESLDDKFIRQISGHIERHLADAAYTVDQLSTDLNMSRVGLYKRILSLTGKSPVEYIRAYRLQKAKPLLQKSQLTIAEVAYEVGFSNPKYFSRYFKQEFGILPSAFAAIKDDLNTRM